MKNYFMPQGALLSCCIFPICDGSHWQNESWGFYMVCKQSCMKNTQPIN